MLAEITGIVASVAKTEASSVLPGTRLAEDLLIKSIGRIELAARIDAMYGTQTSNFEIRRPKTVRELVDLVAGKL